MSQVSTARVRDAGQDNTADVRDAGQDNTADVRDAGQDNATQNGVTSTHRATSDSVEIELISTAQRTTFAAVLLVAAGLYLWALDTTGTVNVYYAQAVSAGSQSWSAMFFGSLDTGNFITVDKPPLSLWVQSLSVRLFGFNEWALLVPQALAGLGTIWLTHDAVRRIWGNWAGIAAAAALAATPVTVAMTRSNLPDTVMTLCMVAGAWMLTRAFISTSQSMPWLLGAFAMVGLGFEAKMLQAWIVLPAFGAAYLFFGPSRWIVRFRQLSLAGLLCLVVSFAWAAAVDLWPGETPWIGGSTDGSVIDLVVGYNGLGRVFGDVGTNVVANRFDAGPSWLRLFNTDNGHQVAWLLPAAAASMTIGAAVAARTRNRLTAAGVTLWGGWMATHVIVFSQAEGIYHPYYTSALAPALAALVGAGIVLAWHWRHEWSVVAAVSATTVGSAALVWMLFERASWNTWIGPLALVASAIAAATMVAGSATARAGIFRIGLVGGLGAVLVAMTTYAGASLVTEPDDGGSPTAGPATIEASGPGGGRNAAGQDGQQAAPDNTAPDNTAPDNTATNQAAAAGGQAANGGGGRGNDDGGDVDELTNWLIQQWDGETWIVAVTGNETAAPISLAGDGAPVMTMGGFSGTDPTPTADELAQYVADGELRYVLAGSGPGGDDQDVVAERTAWIESSCTPVSDAPVNGLVDCATIDT